MKKSVLIAIAAIALAGCAKEAGDISAPALKTRTVTITAGIDALQTRTAYSPEGKFSWVADDVIAVMCANGEEDVIAVPFSTSEGGRKVKFVGEVPEGYELTGIATYPFTESYDGYARNDFVWDSYGYRLWGSFKPDMDAPLSCIPLTGMLDDDGFFQFRTATGIVKFTIINAPKETYYTYLETPAESGAYLNGWFTLDDGGALLMENAISGGGYNERYNWNVPSDVNQTLDVYFFLPVGTLPAGTRLDVCDSGWSAIKSFTFAEPVEVVRNAVVEVAPVEFEPVTVLSLQDVLGEYEMTLYATGPYSTNGEPGDIVLEASDNEALGNVMMTMFAGVPGKAYGTFDGVDIVFSKDQLFGANPYEDAADKPYVALDFYKDSVVDPTFEVLSAGKIKAVNADAIGLRSCTEEDWQTYGGGWPWVLCYSLLTAEWKGSGGESTYTRGEEIPLRPDMIYACNSISWDGQGVPGLVDNDPSTYWHSDWYYAVTTNDPLYGIYFDITLDSEIDAFQFKYQVRANNANSKPTRVVYGVSSDGETWTFVAEDATDEMAAAAAGDWVTLSPVVPDSPARYIRFGIADSSDTNSGSLTGDLNWDGSKKCVNMAELKLFWPE